LIESELKRSAGDRVDFVSIATPNHTHYEIARAAIDGGFNVFCDKPMTLNLKQAEELAKLVGEKRVVFAVTHNYTGYPLVRQARQMVQAGELGEIQATRAAYIQGWLRTRLERDGQKQAAWRTDPARSGAAGCFGDIGTHAYNLGRYISGLLPSQISCNLKIFESGRALDDYGHAVVRYENGGLGTVTASQISHGRENDLTIEIDGTKGSLQWRQEEPNVLVFRQNGKPHALYTRDPNAPYMNDMGRAACRLRAGIRRRSSKLSRTSTARRSTTWCCAPKVSKSRAATRSTRTSTTGRKACSSSSSASPARKKAEPGST
jgi:predicted dehydrogenase